LAVTPGARQTVGMLGPIIIVLVILAIPVGAIMSGAAFAGVLGYFLKKDVDDEYEGTEYLELS
jgi:hypothetical protein